MIATRGSFREQASSKSLQLVVRSLAREIVLTAASAALAGLAVCGNPDYPSWRVRHARLRHSQPPNALENGRVMRALTASQVRDLAPMSHAIEMMKAVFAGHSAGHTISPLRTPIEMPNGSGVVLFMPAYVPESRNAPAAVGSKIVSVFGGNRARGLPTINAIVVVVDPATGVPLGILEGATITALRTGAVSGAATDILARRNARTLAIIGAGAQGVTQAAAVSAVRNISTIRVADLSSEAVSSFADRLRAWSPQAAELVQPAANARDAVEGADIICTATTATRPVFEDAWLSSGAHINAVGAYTPAMQEIPDETIRRAVIVVDDVDAALHEAGDLIQAVERNVISRDTIAIELGHLVSGTAQGRLDDDQITFFKSVGNAIQDMIVAGAALQAAERTGVGHELSLS
ncbi:MAG TPA: ornithine cyclodeaminase [Thermomicrobiales bacterium]|nr:ornithine cyclodeaminase [Thermomicrobiales bacterium]